MKRSTPLRKCSLKRLSAGPVWSSFRPAEMPPRQTRKSHLRRQSIKRAQQASAFRVLKRRVIARANGLCCVRWECCTIAATDAHHRMGQGVQGADVESNLVACCRRCHIAIPMQRARAIREGHIVERRADDQITGTERVQ